MNEEDGSQFSSGIVLLGLCLGACALVLLFSLADLVTQGSIGWAIALFVVLIATPVVVVLHRSKEQVLEEEPAEADPNVLRFTPLSRSEQNLIEEHKLTAIASPAAKGQFDLGEFLIEKSAEPQKPQNENEAPATDDLDARIAALKNALVTHSRAKDALVWAANMHDLGDATAELSNRLFNSGRFGDAALGVQHMKEAVLCYRRALKERVRDKTPFEYATTEAALGDALLAIAKREPILSYVSDSVLAYREALRIFDPGSKVALQSKTNLQTAQALLAKREAERESEADWGDSF